MLLDAKGAKDDIWIKPDQVPQVQSSHRLVLWQDWPDDGEVQARGVEIPNTLKIDDLVPIFDQVDLIAIRFGAFTDGRGFSLARLIRAKGYKGTLRATGPLIPDQFAYVLRCGFDEVEVPDANANRQPPEVWLQAARSFSANYQRGYATGVNILEQRRLARAGR